MPTDNRFVHNGYTADVEATGTVLPTDPHCLAVFEALSEQNAAVRLARFLWQIRADGLYDYEFDTRNGRRWRQVIELNVQDPLNKSSMSFNTMGDRLTVPEFKPGRKLRDTMLTCAAARGVTRFRVVFG